MKKTTFMLLLGVAATIFSAQTTLAQSAEKASLFSLEAYKAKLTADEADKIALASLNATNSKAFKDFSRYFSDASEIKITTEKEGIFINCLSKGVRNRVFYNNKGRWVNTLRYYAADMLPKDVIALLKNEYAEFTPTNVIEVTVGNKTAHLVTIENKSSWKRIKVVDGEMEVYEQFQKS